MKKIVIVILFVTSCLHAQIPLEDRLVKTCQVWGFLKYFHIGPSNCTVKWDSVLMANLPAVKAATNQTTFNNALQAIINAAGPMPWPNTPIPVINPVLNSNLNFSWFNDPLLTTSISSQLDTVLSRFRPHPICNVVANGPTIKFPDDSVNVYPNVAFPTNEQRLLIAFRYWNYIEYWFNSKNLMTTPWDTTLRKHIVSIDTAGSATSFQLSYLRLAAGIDDSHGGYSQGIHLQNNYFGTYYPGFICAYIQNQVVVVKTIAGGTSLIHTGDVITKIDQVPVDTLLNRRKQYIAASNDPALYRDLLKRNKSIFGGPQGSSLTIEFQNPTGTYTETVARNTPSLTFADSAKYQGLPYYTLQYTNCDIGYVNMGKLQPNDVSAMHASLSGKGAIIFDVRNYPNGTAFQIAGLLASSTYPFATLKFPNLQFPGIIGNIVTVSISSTGSSPYNGNIYVLVNSETQSHAEYTTMILQQINPNVKVIGSQTAGADGNISFNYLPSGLSSVFSSYQVCYPDFTIAQRAGVKIDYTVTPTVNGILSGQDEVLDYALMLEGCILPTKIQQEKKNTFSMYPNPSNDRLHLNFESSDISTILIYNSYGQLVEQKTVAGNSADILVTDYEPGVYLIQIKTATGKICSKFIKQD